MKARILNVSPRIIPTVFSTLHRIFVEPSTNIFITMDTQDPLPPSLQSHFFIVQGEPQIDRLRFPVPRTISALVFSQRLDSVSENVTQQHLVHFYNSRRAKTANIHCRRSRWVIRITGSDYSSLREAGGKESSAGVRGCFCLYNSQSSPPSWTLMSVS